MTNSVTIQTALLTTGMFATSVLVASARGEVKDMDRAQITKSYRVAATAMDKMDIRMLSKGMTGDFHFAEKGQRDNKEATIQKITDTWKRLGLMKKFYAEFKPTKFTQKGDKVLVSCDYSFKGTAIDAVQGPGKMHHILDKGTCVDTWAKVNGRWMLKDTNVKRDEMTVDGNESWPGWPTNPWR